MNTIQFIDMRSLRPIKHEPLGVVSSDPEAAKQDAYWAALAYSMANGVRVRGIVEQRQ